MFQIGKLYLICRTIMYYLGHYDTRLDLSRRFFLFPYLSITSLICPCFIILISTFFTVVSKTEMRYGKTWLLTGLKIFRSVGNFIKQLPEGLQRSLTCKSSVFDYNYPDPVFCEGLYSDPGNLQSDSNLASRCMMIHYSLIVTNDVENRSRPM